MPAALSHAVIASDLFYETVGCIFNSLSGLPFASRDFSLFFSPLGSVAAFTQHPHLLNPAAVPAPRKHAAVYKMCTHRVQCPSSVLPSGYPVCPFMLYFLFLFFPSSLLCIFQSGFRCPPPLTFFLSASCLSCRSGRHTSLITARGGHGWTGITMDQEKRNQTFPSKLIPNEESASVLESTPTLF